MNKIDGIKISDEINISGLSIRECVNVVLKWNNFAQERNLPRVTTLTPQRYVNVCHRFEDPVFVLDDIFEAIDDQPLLLGHNRRNWKINFDYITRDPQNKSTYVKVLERGFK